MASTAELTAGWLKSGGQASSPEQAIESLAGQEMSPATEETDTVVRAENSDQEDLLPGESEDTQKDSQESPEEAKAASKEKPTLETSKKEVVTVTDEQGRKRKIEIDYSNKEAVKKAHLLAAGARKWQAERDQAIQSKKGLETEIGEIRGNWSKLDQAFQQNGAEGVFDLLNGPGAFKAYVSKHAERERILTEGTPAQVEELKRREAVDADRRRIDEIERRNKDLEKKLGEKEEQFETRAMQSIVNPSFEKYRFADKLGDPNTEHRLDRMLWRDAMDTLEEYEKQGVDITPELVNKEFAASAGLLKKQINAQAEKKAAKVVEQKKQEATENVQAKVMSGYKTGGNAKEARDLINNGNLTALLKGWNKYGSLFNGGKK